MLASVSKNLAALLQATRGAIVFTKRLLRMGLIRVGRLRVLKPRAVWRMLRKKVRFLRRKMTGKLISGPRTLTDNIRYFANPGPSFEQRDALNGEHLPSRAKTIAFYLPQFHAFAENDEWWGTGFTEWRNVARGTPRFRGHYQPRVPRDLGFYDLSHVDTIAAQCELAKHNGIDAFCFYYYWFNGQRLMQKPLDLFANSDIDQQFCIMWANENWTRTWDGMENDVLIEQDYLDDDEDDFIADTARYMADARYVRVKDQPLFILYRPGLLPDPENTIERWRKKWRSLLGETPLIMMVQGFGEEDPREFGLDGAVEFPPHKVCAGLNNINEYCQFLDNNYKGLVRDYASVVNKSLAEPAADYPLFKTVSPHWDNDARREGAGMTIHGSTPELYEKWLNGALDYAEANPVNDESIVFINAWNEWAEGAYLEPDVHYGHAYLNATKRAVKSLGVAGNTNKLLLVGHDAYKHGAQMLLLNMATIYVQQFGMEVVVVLKEGGPLLADYQRIAPTHVLSKMGKNGLRQLLDRHRFSVAICNTSVTGDLIPELRKSGIRVVSLIHEMPNLIRDYKLESHIQTIAESANTIVYPADVVKLGFESFTESVSAAQVIRPQGSYTTINYSSDARAELRAHLSIGESEKIVLGVGYADLRKGFDLFMETARRVTQVNPQIHFLWVGALSADMQRWVGADFSKNTAHSQIHLVGFTSRVKEYYSAADCLFLPSREDPYPTVVLEAMHIGLPVIAYRGTTGFDELMSSYGYLVDYGDSSELDNSISSALSESERDTDKQQAQRREDYVDEHCQFDDYCFSLLELLHPNLQRVSVVVPNYNYEQYLEQRLSSIFSQNCPIYETIFLDDGSSDNSVAVAERISEQTNRLIRFVKNEKNSGSVFKQWHRGVQLARGNIVWIAEADDSADANFVKMSLSAFGNQTSMVFCDSKQIDGNGRHLSNSYKRYYSEVHPALFNSDFRMAGEDFAVQAMSVRNTILNVSSVLWNRQQLEACLLRVASKLDDYKMVGDWLVYIDLISQKNTEVAFIAHSLNIHRRHNESVTGSLQTQRHLDEIAAMHQLSLSTFCISADTKGAMEEYLCELALQFELEEHNIRRAA